MAVSTVAAPDGTLLDIQHPDDATQEQILQFAAMQYAAGKTRPEPTLMGRLEAAATGAERGFVGTLAGLPADLTALADAAANKLGYEDLIDPETNDIMRRSDAAREQVYESTPIAPGYEDLWTTKFGQGIGSMATFALPGAALKAAGVTAGMSPLAARATYTAAALPPAVGSGVGEARQRAEMARQRGIEITPEDADTQILSGGFIGLSEAYTPVKILKGLPKEVLNKAFFKTFWPRIINAVKNGTAEGVQEVMAQVAQNAVEKGLYDPEKPLLDGGSAFDEFTVGGAVGFAADLVLNAFAGRRARGIKPTPAEEASERAARAVRDRELAEKAKEFPAGTAPTETPSAPIAERQLPDFTETPYSLTHWQVAERLVRERAKDATLLGDNPMPSREEVQEKSAEELKPAAYKRLSRDLQDDRQLWDEILANQQQASGQARQDALLGDQSLREVNAVTKAIRGHLKGVGLKRVQAHALDVIRGARRRDGEVEFGAPDPRGEGAYGAYQRPLNDIFIAVENLKSDPRYQKVANESEEVRIATLTDVAADTMNHEIVHAMRQADLFTAKEWTLLEDLAKKTKRRDSTETYTRWALNAYGEKLSPVGHMEEAIAELIKDGMAGRVQLAPQTRSLLQRVMEFLRGMVGLKETGGYKTFDEILEGIRGGQVAARPEGEIRTLLQTERSRKQVAARGITNEGLGGESRQQVPDFIEPDLAEQRVWHGSPHKWTRPDLSKVGTGQGAASFGWGFYTAEAKAVGETYQRILKDPPVTHTLRVAGVPVIRNGSAVDYSPRNPQNPTDMSRALLQEDILIKEWALKEAFEKGGEPAVKQALNRIIDDRIEMSRAEAPQYVPFLEGVKKRLAQGVGTAIQIDEGSNHLYEIEIPDEAVPRMLDWDAPMTEQSPEVKRAEQLVREQGRQPLSGYELYQDLSRILGSDKAASEYLNANGVPGIKYLDEVSRPTGISAARAQKGLIGPLADAIRGRMERQPTRNYVLFDEQYIKPVSRDGEPIDDVAFSRGEGRPIKAWVPRPSDYESENLMAIGDVEEGVFGLLRRTNNNPTVRQLMNLKGAPAPRKKKSASGRVYNDPADKNIRPTPLPKLRAMVRENLKTEEYRDWYKQFTEGLVGLVGDANMPEATALFGLTSPQTPVEDNLNETLSIMMLARQIDPVEQRGEFIKALGEMRMPNGKKLFMKKADLPKIADFYRDGTYESGFKVTTISQNLMDQLKAEFSPWSVHDTHMAEVFGFRYDDNRGFRNENQYRYAQALTRQLGKEFGLSAREVQSLLWFYGKNKLKKPVAPGTWASARNASAKTVRQLQSMINKGEFDTQTPHSLLADEYLPPANKVKTQTVRYSNYLQNEEIRGLAREKAPAGVVSAVPGNRRGYAFPASMSYEAKAAYNRSIVKAITNRYGKIPFITDMGIGHEVDVSVGSFEGLEPNIIVRLLGGTMAQADYISVILGDALLQDAAITVKPVHRDAAQYYGAAIRKADKSEFTQAELEQIAEAVNPKKQASGMNFTALQKDMLVFIDSKQYNEDIEYTPEMVQAFQEELGTLIPEDISVEVEAFSQDSNYHEAQDYQRRARELGGQIGRPLSPDILSRLDDTLYRPVWDKFTEINQRYGFTPKNNQRPTFEHDPGFGRNEQFEPYWQDSDTVFSRRLTEPALRSGRGLHAGGQKNPRGLILANNGTAAKNASAFPAVHYGRERVDTLQADRYGTGISGAERARLDRATDSRLRRRVYFYVPLDPSRASDQYMAEKLAQSSRRPEQGLGPHVYGQRFGNILNAESSEGRVLGRMGDFNAFESAVIDSGYDGYAVPSRGMMVVLNHDVPVNYLGTTWELADRDIDMRRDREAAFRSDDLSFSRQHDPAQVQTAVNQTLAEETASRWGLERFSSRASPEAQFVARNPAAGLKPADDDVAFMRREASLSPEADRVVRKASPDSPTTKHPFEAYNEATDALSVPSRFEAFLTKMKQDFVNRWARLEKLYVKDESLRDLRASSSAFAAALHVDRAQAIVQGMINYGVPIYEGGWVRVKSADEGGYKSLFEILAPLYSKEHGDLTRLAKSYGIAIRSERLEAEGKKVPLDQGEREIIYREVEQFTDANGNNVIKNWREEWKAYNDFVVKFLMDTGVLSEETAGLWREQADYYPFYRVEEKQGGVRPQGPNIFGGLTASATLRALHGGESGVNMDMVEAITKNLNAAVHMGMNNVAQQRIVRDMLQLGLAKEIAVRSNSPHRTVELRVQGKTRRFEIYDPLIWESMQALSGTDTVTMIKNTFGAPATFLREMVTRDPGFMLVNLLRDSLSAYATSGAKLTPIIDTAKGVGKNLARLEKLGVVGGYELSAYRDDMQQYFNELLKKKGLDGRNSPAGHLKHLWELMGRATTRSDAATRQAVFDDVLARTGDIAEAAFQAGEVINFARRGRSPLIRMLTAVVPFLNARIQGMDVFYRAFTGQYTANKDLSRSRVAMAALLRGSLLMGMTSLYYMLVSDDDEYKKAPEYLKENNWLIPSSWFGSDSGVPVTIPIPFEVGLLFKTIPEAILGHYFGDKTAPEMRGMVRRGIQSTMELSPFQIQFMGPLLEAIVNYNDFTGRQIVPQYMLDGRDPGLQSEIWTSQMAKWVGENVTVPLIGNISPMKIDHVVRGYSGTLGVYLYDLIDMALRTKAVQGDNRAVLPQRAVESWPVVRRFFGKVEDSGLKEDFYELYREVKRVHDTMASLRNAGDADRFRAYIENREALIGLWAPMSSVKNVVDELRKRRDHIMRSDLPADVKREQLELMEAHLNVLLKGIMPQLEQQASMPFTQKTFYPRASQ